MTAAGVLIVGVDAGVLQPLLDDPDVTDVLVNGPASVWVDRGAGAERVDVRLAGEDAVRALAVRLAAVAGRRLDAAAPWVDARLPGGIRLHAVLPPLAAEGTCVSFRLLRDRGLTLEELAGPLAGALRAVVAARLALAVTGATGSGKTTLLSALLSCADPRERVVLVEDAGELRPRLPHVVRLEARAANVEGAGAVGLGELVRQALRMRPDRLVVGEVRGQEVADLLLALTTGHEGGATTVHANGAAELPARLEALGALAGLPRAAVHSQLATALQVVVHVERRGGRRAVTTLGVLVPAGGSGRVEVRPAVTAGSDGVRAGAGWEDLQQALSGRGHPPLPLPSVAPSSVTPPWGALPS